MPEEKLIECFVHEDGKYQRINSFLPGDIISPANFRIYSWM